MKINKYRFRTDPSDPRPVTFPPKHPWWCTGGNEEYSTVVAYAESEEQLREYWPDASDVDEFQTDTSIVFSDRFPKPEWYVENA